MEEDPLEFQQGVQLLDPRERPETGPNVRWGP